MSFDFSQFAGKDILGKIAAAKVLTKIPKLEAGSYVVEVVDLDCWKSKDGLLMSGIDFKVIEASSTATEVLVDGTDTGKIVVAAPPGSMRKYVTTYNSPYAGDRNIEKLVELMSLIYDISIDDAKSNVATLGGVVKILTFCRDLSPADLQKYSSSDGSHISDEDPMEKLQFLSAKKYVSAYEFAKSELQQLVENGKGVQLRVVGRNVAPKDPTKGRVSTQYRWQRA